jgi:hypothetical protein
LKIKTSTYDLCLFISTNPKCFGIVALQTNNSLILGNQVFIDLKEKELKNTKFTAKPKEKLSKNKLFHFNNYILRKIGDNL